jgi:membrane protease YdiL (CAAX protease family)
MSPDQVRSRAARVMQFPLTRIVLGVLFVVPAAVLPQVAAHAAGVHPWAGRLVAIAAAWAAYVVFVRLVEQRPVSELGAAGAAAEAGLGTAAGALLFGLVFLALWLAGVASVGPGAGWGTLAGSVIAALAGAVTEELLFRGVLFRILSSWAGDAIALGVSAGLFGLFHAFNQGASAVSTLAIALEAGVLLAAAYLVTRRLWLAIGMHVGWNFTEGGLFGAPVSGGRRDAILASRFDGPDLLTGGRFGPEASLVAVLVCLAAAAALLVLARRRRARGVQVLH